MNIGRYISKLQLFIGQKIFICLVGIMMTLTVLSLYIAQPYFVTQIDRQIYDMYLRLSAGGEPSPTPAIIDIDEASLQAYGQWPWPRHKIAHLLKIATESGAAAIGLDIMFAEPDRTSPVVLQKSLKDSFGVELSFSGLPAILEDNDKFFASILQATPSVLGSYIQFDIVGSNAENGEMYLQEREISEANVNTTENLRDRARDTSSEKQAPEKALQNNAFQNVSTYTTGRAVTREIPANLPRYEGVMERVPEGAIDPQISLMKGTGIVLPLSELLLTAPIAFLNVAPDSDGIIRAIPLVMVVDDRIFLSIGVRTLMRGLGTKNIVLESDSYGLCALYIQKYRIPVSPTGMFYIPYRGPRGVYPYYSAKDILDGKIPPEELQGRVLFLGTSASGLLDIRATPFDAIYPGVESHATIVDAILTDRSMSVPVWTPVAQIALIITTGILATFLFGFAPASVYLPLFACMCAGSIGLSWYLFTNEIFLSPHYSLLTIVSLLVALLGLRFIYEVKQKSQLRKAFTRYVAPEMVNRITERGEVVLSGEEREVTLIFTDIRDFTHFSEKLHPSKVVDVLNRYFTPMTRLIQSSHGTVDKFIGDAIMAFWNAPLDVDKHELKAVRVALEMQNELNKLNVQLQEELGVTLSMGAGLHTGTVYVGNMGSEELLDYTCIGDNVNLCSRLEGMCSYYGVQTVISGVTAERCLEILRLEEGEKMQSAQLSRERVEGIEKNIDKNGILSDNAHYSLEFILLDYVRVKGKEETVSIYLPVTFEEYSQRQVEFEIFKKARALYAQAKFDESSDLFTKLCEEYGHVVFYRIFLDRSEKFKQEYIENKDNQDSLEHIWTDVWNFVTK